MSATEFRLKNLPVQVRNVNSWKEAKELLENGGNKIALLLDSELIMGRNIKYFRVLIMGESQVFAKRNGANFQEGKQSFKAWT